MNKVEFECGNMTSFGCGRMDSVKELMLLERIENNEELDLNGVCKNQCCKDCDNLNKCSYTCGRISWKDPVEEFEKEEIKQVDYEQLSFF